MKTIDIKYCAQDLKFEEAAYKKFELYESQLKEYFLTQPDGSEIFEDLKLRICEMLQSKMKVSGVPITEADVADIKNSIGEVNELEDFETGTAEDEPMFTETIKDKKLYRSQNEKVVGGVCGGLGNYFSIDPLAFRILFVLVTLISKGVGLLAYIIMWVVLKPKFLPENLSKRLYRNPSDKIIAGVCGGLASFFKTEAWIVRIIFLSPIILNVGMEGFLGFDFTFFNGSAIGFVIIAYIVLWITTKEKETPMEELLSRGEDININTMTEEKVRINSAPSANSSINTMLRIIAFILIGIIIIPLFFTLVGLSVGSFFMLPLTSAVLYSPLLKWLGALTFLFFILLPLVAFIVWGLRRMTGAKGPNNMLRMSFGGLWALGLASAITLAALLLGEMNTKSYVETKTIIPVIGDTLYVNELEDDFSNSGIVHSTSFIKNFYEEENGEQYSRIVSYKKRVSPNDSFYVKTKIVALGKARTGAAQNAKIASYRTEFRDNQLYLARHLSIPSNQPFRFQHAEVTVYVPKGKMAILEKEFNGLHFGNNVIRYGSDDDWDWEDMSDEERREVKKDIDEAMDDVSEAINEIGDGLKEAADEIDNVDVTIKDDEKQAEARIRQAEKRTNENIKQAEKRTKAKIELEKQKLRLRKEQLKLEKLEREMQATQE